MIRHSKILSLTPVTVDRLKSFSDNIYAFSMTLLITGLHFPEIPDARVPAHLFEALGYDWRHLVIYVISFISISSYWILHHYIYSHIVKSDRGLVWLNVLLLLSVTFLPFPTALMGKYGRHASTALVYGIALSVNYVFLNLLAWYAYSFRRLSSPDLSMTDACILQLKLLFPLSLAIIGTILAQFYTRLSFLLFFAVALANVVPWHYLLEARLFRDQPADQGK